MNVFIVTEDINRWLNEDRTDIIACLTWFKFAGNIPEEMLYIPKKLHIVGHSFLGKFYKREWSDDKSCIFLHDGKCSIYKTRPKTCRDFPRGNIGNPCPGMTGITKEDARYAEELCTMTTKDRMEIFRNRDTFTKTVKRAKEDASLIRLAQILGVKEEDEDERTTKENNK
jgi:Fe-S-cluster containining protein